MQVILERAEEYRCYKTALHTVIEVAKAEFSLPDVSFAENVISPTKQDPQRRPKSSASSSAVQVRNYRRRSSGHLDEDVEPEQQLARNLGISLPSGTMMDQSRLETLERALSDRMSKLDGHATSLQSTTESSISSHLSDVHSTLQILEDCLLDEPVDQEVQLINPAIHASVTSIEQNIEALRKQTDEVDLQKLQAKNVYREELVRRWAR